MEAKKKQKLATFNIMYVVIIPNSFISHWSVIWYGTFLYGSTLENLINIVYVLNANTVHLTLRTRHLN